MPLPAATPRAPIHNRTIVCDGYRREDGLWDIEGRLVDTKSYPFANTWRTEVQPGEPLHEMLVRLTVDNDFTVVAVETASEHTPHRDCGDILPNFQRIVGLRIGPGWSRRIKELTGGVQGCAHHVELINLLATVAFQTMGPLLARERARSGASEPVDAKAFLVNSCHIWRPEGEWARAFAADPNGTLGARQAPVDPEPAA
jgi:hypothetical protein